MLIGIDASRAFEKNRTGIEEYSYQVIKHLTGELKNHQVILYLRKSQFPSASWRTNFQISLPENWKIKVIKFPYLWTQIGLSLELLFHPVDTLFIPAHIVPCIHPKNTIVTIHGLEYEFCPQAYSIFARLYMRWSIKKSCQWAKTIIAVSENTKRDLIKLYKVPEGKIEVIYEGVGEKYQAQNLSFRADPPAGGEAEESNSENLSRSLDFARDDNIKFLLFIGRLEERKNILGIIEAYRILKEKYDIPHSLVLAGAPGYNYEIIKLKIENYSKISILHNRSIEAKCNILKIIELGYVSEKEKWELLKNADVFLFPTFYEGFGLPILEAQSIGVPVVASNNSSIPEVAYNSALLVNPKNPSEISEAAYKLISDKTLRNDIINRGYENVKRFSWSKCADSIAKLLNG